VDIVDFLENKNLSDVAQPLSNRELQILRYLSRGVDVAGIARLLKISRNTVKAYMANLSTKIQMPTTKTNFRVALCIFYNKYKGILEDDRS